MYDYDVFLAGYADAKWRSEFGDKIARDITIFDSMTSVYHLLDNGAKANLVAQELQNIELCEIVVFYLCPEWNSLYSMIVLGAASGSGKQIIVCMEPGIQSEEKIKLYCEYKGILVVNTLDDLVESVEECLSQAEIVASLGLDET